MINDELDPIHAHLANHAGPVRPWLTFANGRYLSVQASEGHYCSPRGDHGPWHMFEVGPADHRVFPELRTLREGGDPNGVHGWVPLSTLLTIVARLGIKEIA